MSDVTQPSSEDVLALGPMLGAQSSTDFDIGIPRPRRTVYEPVKTEKGTIYRRNPIYVGANRVDSKNRFVLGTNGQALGPYDEMRDAKNELYKLDDVDRLATLKRVQKVLGGRYSPSRTGLSDSDFGAFETILRQANAMGRTWDVALDYLASQPGSVEGPTRTYRLTSSEDIRMVAQEVAIKTLGSGLTSKQMQRIIKAVQAEDVRSQQPGTREGAADLNVQVLEEVERMNPQEAMIQGAASIGEMMTKALGGS